MLDKSFRDLVRVFCPIQSDQNPTVYSIIVYVCLGSRPCEAWPKILAYIYIYIYIYISEVGGSETNREIDFGFGSCVRARALDVRWEFGIS